MREFKPTTKNQVSEAERLIQEELKETTRLVFVVRESANKDDFLEQLLDGRPCEPEFVKKLVLFTLSHFEEANPQRPAVARETILKTCQTFLGDEEFSKLKPKGQTKRHNIFDDFADEAFARTGERDPFLEGLRHAE